MQNNIDLGKDNILGLLLRLSVPATLSMLVAALYNFADRVVVGRVNPLGLSAIGVTMPFQVVQMAFVLLIGVGSATLISIKYGKGDIDGASDVLFTGFVFIVISQLIISILCMIFIEPIFSVLKIGSSLHDLSYKYISIIVIGAVPALTGYCLNNSVRALGYARESMFYVSFSSILNIALDIFFVLVFGWGVRGAAIATISSEFLVTIFVIRFFTSNKSSIKLHFSREYLKSYFEEKKYFHTLLEIISAGTPSFFMQLFGVVVTVLLNNSILQYGADYHMAAVTIVNSVSMLFTMVIYGISQGMQPIIGYNFGSGDYKRVSYSYKLTLIFVLIVAGGGLGILLLFAEQIVSIFVKNDKSLLSLTSGILRVFLLGIPMIGAHSITTTFLQSTKKSFLATLLNVLRYGGILIPLLYIIPPIYGINGVYISNAVSDILAGLVALIIVFNVIKKEKYARKM